MAARCAAVGAPSCATARSRTTRRPTPNGTTKYAHADAPLYSINDGIFKEDREPLPFARPLFRLVQLDQDTQGASRDPRDGRWSYRQADGYDGRCAADRRRGNEGNYSAAGYRSCSATIKLRHDPNKRAIAIIRQSCSDSLTLANPAGGVCGRDSFVGPLDFAGKLGTALDSLLAGMPVPLEDGPPSRESRLECR
jgi:hypothetical protein